MIKSLISLKLHQKLRGKLIISSKKALINRNVLSKVYTPGVAEAVEEIAKNTNSVYSLTIKNNSVAVVSDGSAVLGLGNVGGEAALPVMEGKCAIFKEFAGIDAFPICLKTQDVDEIINTIVNISPVFGGINMEDISAPRCFEIETKLQKLLDIPIMHDDQHATAIVVLAGLINASKIVKKDLTECKIVIVGAGAAGCATAKLLSHFSPKELLILDREGIISKKRTALPFYKQKISRLTNKRNISGGLKDAAEKADILIGLSRKGLFTKEIVKILNPNPIIFALANPDPELNENDAKRWGVSVYANGRSDCTNQINNALVFPGFFKGLLQKKITIISNEMKIRAAYALASLVKKPTPKYFIPSIFDKKVVPGIANSIQLK